MLLSGVLHATDNIQYACKVQQKRIHFSGYFYLLFLPFNYAFELLFQNKQSGLFGFYFLWYRMDERLKRTEHTYTYTK